MEVSLDSICSSIVVVTAAIDSKPSWTRMYAGIRSVRIIHEVLARIQLCTTLLMQDSGTKIVPMHICWGVGNVRHAKLVRFCKNLAIIILMSLIITIALIYHYSRIPSTRFIKF